MTPTASHLNQASHSSKKRSGQSNPPILFVPPDVYKRQEADTVLTVNGELKIASGAAEVLARYLQITVNGQVYCPRSLSGKLGNRCV